MNFCRGLRASNSHLWKRACTTVTSSSGVENHLICKRNIATVVSPAATSVKADDLSKTNQKSKMFEKLQDRIEKEAYRTVEETLNTFNKEDGVISITQSDLFGWAKRLDEDGKHQHAHEIFEWIKRKKTTLSPSELATFVAADGVKAAKTPREKKEMMFEVLKDLSEKGRVVEEALDTFTRMKEQYGVSITKTDLIRWSILIDRYGRPEISVQIFEWMERKKMKFSPSQLATFVDFIDRVHGLSAALGYFESVDPDFDNMDYNAKNWPAYDFLARSMSRNSDSRPR